jgi:lysophospholipase L1-like esterase
MTKHIVCFGDSNTYGFNAFSFGRFDQYTRWTNVAQARLNEIAAQQGTEKFKLTNEGLNGRTIDMSILKRSPEGNETEDFYSLCLDKRKPMDLLILMIGSNNCLSPDKPERIAEGCEWMVRKALWMDIWKDTPRILLLAPAVIGGDLAGSGSDNQEAADNDGSRMIVPKQIIVGELTGLRFDDKDIPDYNIGTMIRSRAIVPLYRDIAERYNLHYLDVNKGGVTVASVDHVHLDESGHLKMAEIITDKVLEIFGVLK